MARERRLLALCVVVASLVMACRTTPTPFVPADLRLRTSVFTGSPVSGAVAQAAAVAFAAEDCLAVRARFFVLAGDPPAGAQSIAGHVRLVLAPRSADPILGTPRRLAGAMLLDCEAADPWLAGIGTTALPRIAMLGDAAGVVAPGTTLAMGAEWGPWTAFCVEVLVHLDADDGSVSVAVLDRGPADPPAPAASDGPRAGLDLSEAVAVPAEEIVVLDRPVVRTDAPPLVLVPLANPLAGDGPTWLIAVIDWSAGATLSAPRLAQAREEVAQARSSAAVDERELTPRRVAALRLASTRAALAARDTRRGALLSLAEQHDAPLAADLALAGSEPRLDAVLALPEGPSPADTAALTFVIEARAFALLADDAQQRRLPPAEQALLLRHAGQLAQLPSRLADVVSGSATPAELRRRLVADNLALLDDRSAAARLRACEFLRSCDAVPEGYDPMLPEAQRRALLEPLLTGQRGVAAP